MALLQSGVEVDKEIRHFSHSQHALNMAHQPYLYICNGCKEPGAGPRYRLHTQSEVRCNQCDFNIHEFCSKAPATLTHPYHTQHQLIFHKKPSAHNKSKCFVCGKATNGFAFRCSTCNFCLHPCCSQLPAILFVKAHPQHTLKLLPGSLDGSPYTCNFCKKRGTTWVYCCAACGFYLHALCAKTAIKSMEVEGINVPEKQSKFARAIRYASHITQLFVNGLVETLGQGAGEAIFDNFTRGVNPIKTEDL
ncbi:hypothetical protein KI387_014323 [Taxus chinensis]|uniref:DC1 domain-containing protein n=1 Tax=Taxus chinensis TaxID=29808 RepID=A0AA38FHT7_TAXCH|nr:hypothetical protein KI387_014323 [Taxus chinensis]